MPRRKQTKRTTVKDLRTILRLAHEHGLSMRAISERLRPQQDFGCDLSVASARGGLSWPLPLENRPPSFFGQFAIDRAEGR
jgi:hypothetical protein